MAVKKTAVMEKTERSLIVAPMTDQFTSIGMEAQKSVINLSTAAEEMTWPYKNIRSVLLVMVVRRDRRSTKTQPELIGMLLFSKMSTVYNLA